MHGHCCRSLLHRNKASEDLARFSHEVLALVDEILPIGFRSHRLVAQGDPSAVRRQLHHLIVDGEQPIDDLRGVGEAEVVAVHRHDPAAHVLLLEQGLERNVLAALRGGELQHAAWPVPRTPQA